MEEPGLLSQMQHTPDPAGLNLRQCSQSALLEPGALKTLCLGTLHLHGAKHFHCYTLEFSASSILPSRTFSNSLGIRCKILL